MMDEEAQRLEALTKLKDWIQRENHGAGQTTVFISADYECAPGERNFVVYMNMTHCLDCADALLFWTSFEGGQLWSHDPGVGDSSKARIVSWGDLERLRLADFVWYGE